MSKDEVVLLDFWVSPFAMRVKIALLEKGVEFEARQEDVLRNKSELLLQSNPVHKKVPVLLVNGKPLCESLVILNYIEEKWPTPSLFPPSVYDRTVARFWADFADKKIFDVGAKIWKDKEGEAKEAGAKEFIEVLKLLEGYLGEKDYFGGESFGFVDIAIIPLSPWFFAYEQLGGFKVEEECPKFSAWIKRCGERESVAKVLPEPAKVCEFVRMLRKMHGIE